MNDFNALHCPCRVNKRALVPGTVFFEAAFAAAASMCSAAEPSLEPCLLDAAIAAPKLLAAQDSMLQCEVDMDGSLSIRSADRGAMHVSCHLACLPSAASTQHGQRPAAAISQALIADSAHLRSNHQRAAAAMGAVAAPAACAGMGSRSGFVVHPAAGDASLHLGAVPPVASVQHSAAAAESAPSKVPVSLSAYTATVGEVPAGGQPSHLALAASTEQLHHSLCCPRMCAGNMSWALAGPAEPAGDSSAVSDAWWLPGNGRPGSGMKLQRLVARQLSQVRDLACFLEHASYSKLLADTSPCCAADGCSQRQQPAAGCGVPGRGAG